MAVAVDSITGTMTSMRRVRFTISYQLPAIALIWMMAVSCSITSVDQDIQHPLGDQSPSGKPTASISVEQQAACHALQTAQPHEWNKRIAAVCAFDQAPEKLLINEFRNMPAAPGGQATLATLGRIGTSESVELCRELVSERAPLAVEAALALGELPGVATDAALLTCVQDRHSDIALRVAAACSLARHGEQKYAPNFIAAIVRAGTPAGRADEQTFGLPDKSRWARERYFVQYMLRQLGHRDLSDALDTDAPWQVLEQLAPQVRKRLSQQ